MSILVAGGAGYVGSHVCARLKDEGKDIIVADNLSTGHKDAVKFGKLYVGDICDIDFLEKIFSENKIDAVMDFAALSLVGESMVKPLDYFKNNVISVLRLLEVMVRHGVKNIVFSSSAAVYGEPERQPILETDKKEPTNPYGESKLCIEKILRWADEAYGIRYAALRYFNVAGARYELGIGEDHNPETHLIAIVLQVAQKKRELIKIFGTDYDTPDGTCIRDYIDARDLADAHALALKYLQNGGKSESVNLGYGKGFSVKEVIETAREVTSEKIPAVESERRAGDPAMLVADNKRALDILGWIPKHNNLHEIIDSAWKWHYGNPNGFDDKK